MAATAEDLWPMVMQLPREERLRLARMALATVALPADAPDRARYEAVPVAEHEFADPDMDPLAWDGDGWDPWS